VKRRKVRKTYLRMVILVVVSEEKERDKEVSKNDNIGCSNLREGKG